MGTSQARSNNVQSTHHLKHSVHTHPLETLPPIWRPGRPQEPERMVDAPSQGGSGLLRKEVIQPHLPVRLPCYDFVLIASPTFDHSLR